MDNRGISVLLVGRIIEEDEVFQIMQQIAAAFTSHGSTQFYLTDARIKEKMMARHPNYVSHVFAPSLHQQSIHYIVTVGGDGTILYAAKEFFNEVPPLISFQRGSLGFMCRFHLQQIDEVVQSTVQHHHGKIEMPFDKSRLMRLETTKMNTLNKEQPSVTKICINEVFISRKAQERITLQIFVNGEYLTSTAGDGILISTPTGSTAYSLSAGGPILQNGVNAILMVPIAPNSLSFRPICFPSDSEVRIRLHKFSRSTAYLSFDGQSTCEFGFGQQMVVRRAKHDIIFLQPKPEESAMPTWIQRLKFFLGWNEKYKAAPVQYTPQINTHACKKECIEDD